MELGGRDGFNMLSKEDVNQVGNQKYWKAEEHCVLEAFIKLPRQ